MSSSVQQRLVELRREFHRYPEPAWCEFVTTARVVEEVERIGVDELAVGAEAYDPDDRMAVPDAADIDPWFERASERVDEELLSRMAGGNTGAVAVLDRGSGPSIGLRVDIDALFIEESTSDDHEPAANGFRTENETMHGCGHDAHITWGLAVLEMINESDFEGCLTVFFQPAEEISGGGHPMAESEYAADLDYLFAVHIGLDHPTGEVVAGIERPLAMCHLNATFHGTSAHAGTAPNEGDNAMQALGTAIQNAYGIPRHRDGMTRVNIGMAEAGTASNVIADRARIHGEARGETTELMEYTKDELQSVLWAAADTHGCDVDVNIISESPRTDSDPELAAVVADAAKRVDGVGSVVPTADFGASEDATFLMKRVQREGGLATYLIVGTDHPTSHHTPAFDVDERSLAVGVEVLRDAILTTAEEQP